MRTIPRRVGTVRDSRYREDSPDPKGAVQLATSAIEAEGLVKNFKQVRALDGIDLVATEGTVFGLLGPNGAGKTTAIRVLSTLILPDAGRASVAGYDVVRQPAEVRRNIGLTGQYAAVDELLSGHENLYMIGRLLGFSTADAKARATELLEADIFCGHAKVPVSWPEVVRRRGGAVGVEVGVRRDTHQEPAVPYRWYGLGERHPIRSLRERTGARYSRR
jgi:ABC-type oligopeptide transport system ATPase subunit